MRPTNLAKALTLMTLCGSVAALSGGCVENRTTLYIDGVIAFEAGGDCEVEVSLESSKVLGGSYDPATGTSYALPLLFANGLQPLGDSDTLRPETSVITLEGLEVSISSVASPGAGSAFTVPAAGTIYPADGEDPGLSGAIFGLPLYDLGLSTGSYNFGLIAFGKTHGGLDVESTEFNFPITVLPAGSRGVCDNVDLDDEALHACYPTYVQDSAGAYRCGDFGVTVGNCANCP